MKLIDLLVQELPKRGGWPEGATEICWHGKHENYAYFYGAGGAEFGQPVLIPRHFTYEGDANGFDITHEQYESALAASQQPAWNGEGLPPVGCECESLHCFEGSKWQRIVIKWSDENQFLYEWLRDGHPVHHLLGYVNQFRFRPIRTEAERKRDEAKNVIAELCRSSASNGHSADLIYDAITAGKIPHITLK